METGKILTAILLCLLIISCGCSEKNKKHEPVRRSNKRLELIEKKKAIVNEAEEEKSLPRYNGNHRKPSQRQREESRLQRKPKEQATVPLEEDPAKASMARIEKRVQLELEIWKAKEKGNSTLVDKLRDKADDLEKEMRQPDLDKVYKRLKDLKKRM